MKIDYELIKAAFPVKAWAYAELHDSIKIGKWDGFGFTFFEPLIEDYLLNLRIFDDRRELKFSGDKCRDSANYDDGDFISELADAQYFMYGENYEFCGEFTKLWEDRGGIIYFPKKLEFPELIKDKNAKKVNLKLGIRNFVRYNQVPILPIGKEYDFGLLDKGGAGALEVVDYVYTGFYYTDETEVQL